MPPFPSPFVHFVLRLSDLSTPSSSSSRTVTVYHFIVHEICIVHKLPKASVKASVKEKGVKPSHLIHLHTAFLRVVVKRWTHKSKIAWRARICVRARGGECTWVKKRFAYWCASRVSKNSCGVSWESRRFSYLMRWWRKDTIGSAFSSSQNRISPNVGWNIFDGLILIVVVFCVFSFLFDWDSLYLQATIRYFVM